MLLAVHVAASHLRCAFCGRFPGAWAGARELIRSMMTLDVYGTSKLVQGAIRSF